jgi:cytochrome b561
MSHTANTSTLRAQTRTTAYAFPAISLHWILAILISGMVGLGWFMMEIEDDPGSDWYFNLHKSIGLLIVLLVVVRVLWRVTNRPAPLPASTPTWEVTASGISHWVLYACMVAMPIQGLVGTMLSDQDLTFFGLVIPRLFAENGDLSEIFFEAHSITAWVLVGMVGLHALAAIKHLVMDKDGVFQRMWFS